MAQKGALCGWECLWQASKVGCQLLLGQNSCVVNNLLHSVWQPGQKPLQPNTVTMPQTSILSA